jgi:hypothetical protein
MSLYAEPPDPVLDLPQREGERESLSVHDKPDIPQQGVQ